MYNPPNNGTPPPAGAPAPSPDPDAQARPAAYQRLRALRGSEPDAVDIPRRQPDSPE